MEFFKSRWCFDLPTPRRIQPSLAWLFERLKIGLGIFHLCPRAMYATGKRRLPSQGTPQTCVQRYCHRLAGGGCSGQVYRPERAGGDLDGHAHRSVSWACRTEYGVWKCTRTICLGLRFRWEQSHTAGNWGCFDRSFQLLDRLERSIIRAKPEEYMPVQKKKPYHKAHEIKTAGGGGFPGSSTFACRE